MGEDLEKLEREYCPPMDPALVHAIFSDYGDNPDRLQIVREVLDGLKEPALQEQFTDFDPSGSSGNPAGVSPSKNGSSGADSNAESAVSQSTITDCTSVSDGLWNLRLSPPGSNSDESFQGGYFKDTEGFDTPTKEVLLADMFHTLRPDLIAFTLKKCKGEFGKATDELLNHVYFEDSHASPGEDTVVAKGIDAFFEDNHVPQRGRGKGKKKKKGSPLSTSFAESESSSAVSSNKWKDSHRDIDFIVSRTKLSNSTVASLYHANGASLRPTILAILQQDIDANKGVAEPEAELVSDAVELVSEFAQIEYEIALALIRITAPSTAYAHELAKALTNNMGSASGNSSGIKVTPQYAPMNMSDAIPTLPKTPALAPTIRPYTTESLSVRRNEAFTKASEAYRKGKSNPHFKAVAGVYAQDARDMNDNLREINEAEADALVNSQSSPTQLDLHGVSVPSAVRIAKQKVQQWWDRLGEERIPGGGRKGVGQGYHIITGLGRHSERGRGKIGPAVVKALVKEGWKLEVGSGDLVVVELARRR
jgi:hypothetical protein